MGHVPDGYLFRIPRPLEMADGRWLIGFLKLGGMRAYAAPFTVDNEADALALFDTLRD